MTQPALLAEVWRGTAPELAIRGHVAVIGAGGRLIAGCGDPSAVTTLRSAVKPLQTLPFVAGGAGDRFAAGDDELAVACGSHDGSAPAVAAVRRLLARAGVDESQLRCAPHPPYSEAAARALAVAGETPGRIHNNCSGKHAAMLATCVHRGWPVDDYTSPEHPLQREVAAAIGRLAGVDVEAAPRGVDGCGLPTYGLPLAALGRAFAAAGGDDAFRRCQAAMAAHPILVAGEGRFDTALLAAAGHRLTAKSGGAAVWVAVARPDGPAIAVKLEAGVGAQLAPVALAALHQVGLLPRALPEALVEHAAGRLRNWAGEVVGETRLRLRLEPA